MKKALSALFLIICMLLATSCGSKITNENIFKPGTYEARTNGELSSHYTFYSGDNGGTIDNIDGVSGLPFRYDIIEVNGNKAKLMFHFADESDNTEVTVTMKNENEYSLKYSDKTDELKFLKN